MKGGFTNIFKELNLVTNLIYFGGTMRHKGFCLFLSKLCSVLPTLRKEGWRGGMRLFCFEERRSLKDYILLLGYGPCFSHLPGISCDAREDKKRFLFFFSEKSLHPEL